MKRPAPSARTLALLVLAAIGLGCAARQVGPGRAAVPAETVTAVAGRAVVIPLPPTQPLPAGAVPANLGGRPVPAVIRRLTARSPAGLGTTWIEAPAVWSEADAQGRADVVFVQVEIPPDASDGTLSVGGRTYDLRARPPATPQALPALPARGDLYDPGTVSGRDAWRRGLAGLGLGGLATLHPGERAAALSHFEQWRTGLDRLERTDRWLAGRVMHALTRTADVSGVRAPAWSLDADGERRLLDDLLDDGLSDVALADRVRAWLLDGPDFAARVRDPASAGVIAVQVTDLAGRSTTASISDGSASGAGTLLRAGRSVTVPAPVHRGGQSDPVLIASAGAHSVRLVRPVETITATPPGARIGPLFMDLTRRDWLDGRAGAVPAELAVAGLLQRRPRENAWELYLECKAPPGLTMDEATVWLGAREADVAVLRVRADGSADTMEGTASIRVLGHEVRADRWTALLLLPPEAVSPDGVMLLGLTRVTGDGSVRVRSSWPVALLPWEEEPGRTAIDLTGWLDLQRR